jgi:hypothetical protein
MVSRKRNKGKTRRAQAVEAEKERIANKSKALNPTVVCRVRE